MVIVVEKKHLTKRELKSPSFRIQSGIPNAAAGPLLGRIKIYWPTWWWWWHERNDDNKEDAQSPRNRTRVFQIGIPHCPYPPFRFNTSSRPPPYPPSPLQRVRWRDAEKIRRRILPSAEQRTRGRVVVGISFPTIRWWFLITPAELTNHLPLHSPLLRLLHLKTRLRLYHTRYSITL